jgi:hypothetical protein
MHGNGKEDVKMHDAPLNSFRACSVALMLANRSHP